MGIGINLVKSPKIKNYPTTNLSELVNKRIDKRIIEENLKSFFEKNLSKFVNRKYACAVSSGTAALEIAVKSLGLNKNDEIIMPSFTIISNAIAIIKNFAKPVLIDSDLDTWNIDIQKIEKKINTQNLNDE